MDRRVAIRGRREDRREISLTEGAIPERIVGVRPSITLALAKFCCSLGRRSSYMQSYTIGGISAGYILAWSMNATYPGNKRSWRREESRCLSTWYIAHCNSFLRLIPTAPGLRYADQRFDCRGLRHSRERNRKTSHGVLRHKARRLCMRPACAEDVAYCAR